VQSDNRSALFDNAGKPPLPARCDCKVYVANKGNSTLTAHDVFVAIAMLVVAGVIDLAGPDANRVRLEEPSR
jgi:hypothetical protein